MPKEKAKKKASAKKKKKDPSGKGKRKGREIAALDDLLSSTAVKKAKKLAEQAKEPLGLLEQLKEEGLARAGYLLGVASGVAGNLTKSSVRKQLKEFSDIFGIATRDDIDWLESRINDLERRLEALEQEEK